MLLTPGTERIVECAHGLRHGRPIGVRNINRHRREPSALQAFGIAEAGAVATRQRQGLILRDVHVVDIVAPPLRVVG